MLENTRVLEDGEIHFHRCEANGNGVEGLTGRCREERELIQASWVDRPRRLQASKQLYIYFFSFFQIEVTTKEAAKKKKKGGSFSK